MPEIVTGDHLKKAARFFDYLHDEISAWDEPGFSLDEALRCQLKAVLMQTIYDLARGGRQGGAERQLGILAARYTIEPAVTLDISMADYRFNPIRGPHSSSLRWVIERSIGDTADFLCLDTAGEMALCGGYLHNPRATEPISGDDQLSRVGELVGDYFSDGSGITQVETASLDIVRLRAS